MGVPYVLIAAEHRRHQMRSNHHGYGTHNSTILATEVQRPIVINEEIISYDRARKALLKHRPPSFILVSTSNISQ